MPGKQLTPMDEANAFLQEQIKRREQMLIQIAFYTGEAGLIVARMNGNYTDRTGNLRSSTGYVVVQNGRVLQISDFQQVPPKKKKKGDKYDGGKEGEKFAKKILNKFMKGIAIIEVAGMNYSGYLSAKGYDVLDSAEDEVKRVFLQLLKAKGFILK